jgi:murein DD-endopeptidase MepM/ murein hydrolase activator NlpD
MKRWLSLILSMLCVTGLLASVAFAIDPQPLVTGGEDLDFIRDELSPEQEQAMWVDIQRNVTLLRSAGLLAAPDTSQTVTYNFPLRLAPGLPDYAGFRVSAFVDHNSASGASQILDYNGGTRTYDGHRGTDYALWPFSWNKLDAGDMQVIAAAAGIIVSKNNTDATDHNPCDGGSNSDTWNYVAVAHADGRLTLYGHMRYNSLTSKGSGQAVAQGEYLGTAASSGFSSGPHLHFEVRYGDFANDKWIDPYAGPNSQPGSLWTSQRPYLDSAINKLSTHSGPPSTPNSCAPYTTKLQDSFITPANIYFYVYYRDYQGALATQIKIYRPDGSVFQSASYTDGSTFSSAWYHSWAYAFSNSDPAGTWHFEATYNSQIYETFFNVNSPTTITIGSPNGGEQWDRKAAHAITWTDNLGGEVNIALYHNSVYSATLASNTASDGEYLWTPDAALPIGSGYTIRVTSVISPNVYAASDASFALIDAPLMARNDFAITPVTTPVTIDILSNDEEPAGKPITITALGFPLSGTINLINAQLVYTPTLSFLGSDVFTYTVSSSTEQASATVSVLVVNEVFPVFLPLIQR